MVSKIVELPRSLLTLKHAELGAWHSNQAEREEAATTIIKEVIARRKVGFNELTGRGRSAYIVEARREVSIRIYRETGLGTPAIGKLLGRDSATIRALIKRAMPQNRKRELTGVNA